MPVKTIGWCTLFLAVGAVTATVCLHGSPTPERASAEQNLNEATTAPMPDGIQGLRHDIDALKQRADANDFDVKYFNAMILSYNERGIRNPRCWLTGLCNN